MFCRPPRLMECEIGGKQTERNTPLVQHGWIAQVSIWLKRLCGVWRNYFLLDYGIIIYFVIKLMWQLFRFSSIHRYISAPGVFAHWPLVAALRGMRVTSGIVLRSDRVLLDAVRLWWSPRKCLFSSWKARPAAPQLHCCRKKSWNRQGIELRIKQALWICFVIHCFGVLLSVDKL